MLSYSIRPAGWQTWKHGRGERERQRGLTSTFGPNVETRTDRAHPDRIGFVERRSRGTASLNYSFGISWDYQCDSWQRWLPKAGKGEGMRFRIGGGIRVYANLLWPLRATRPIPIPHPSNLTNYGHPSSIISWIRRLFTSLCLIGVTEIRTSSKVGDSSFRYTRVKKLVRKKVIRDSIASVLKYRNFGRKIHCLPIKWTSGLLRIVGYTCSSRKIPNAKR